MYSQDNEDILLNTLLISLGRRTNVTYIDIGAGDPVIINNTFYFYQKGEGCGVLIDPLPWNHQKIREKRPRDVLLEGVVCDGKEKEVFIRVRGRHGGGSRIVSEKPPENKRQALAKTYRINDVLAYFRRTPDFISIDAEGFDLRILKDLDFKTYQIPLFCIETEHDKNIVPFMYYWNYEVMATTRSNTIFKLKP